MPPLHAERERIKAKRETDDKREGEEEKVKLNGEKKERRTSNSRCIMHPTGLAVPTAVSSRVLFEIKSFSVNGGPTFAVAST